jgi:hypothetical protein
MTSITQTIPSFTGGISQQPDELMLPGQVKDLLNGVPDITEGLVKRPGSRYLNSLSGATSTGSWFSYYRDQSEGAYIGQVQTNGSVNMWKVSDGSTVSVGGNASGYLTHSTTADLKFLTVADTTFVTNTTKTVEDIAGQFSPTRAASVGRSGEEFQTFVELRQVSHGREYSFDVASPSATEEFIGGSSSKGRVTRISVKENPYTTQTNKNNIIYDSNNFRLSIERNTSGNTYEGIDPELPFQGTEILSVSGGSGSGMIIRLTVTGQVNVSKHSGNTLKPDEYVGVYNIVAELLHGGLDYTSGNTVTAVLKGVTYEIDIDEIQPIKTKKDLGTYRPAPTSFDPNQTISADTILDIVKANADITPHVQKIGNGFFLSHETAFNVTTAQPDLWRITSTEVNDVSELPRQCKHGMVVEVVNSSESQEDNFYLKFVGENNIDGPGRWEETLGPGQLTSLDQTTLPIKIQRQANGNFQVSYVTWTDRQVGDGNTNPFPTFLDKKISQTFFHRNRLGFLCEDNIILSQADEIFNFFNNTALVVSGNDPIDIQSSSTQPTRFVDCIETNTGLLVFAETQQFMLHTDSDALTPDTAKLSNISTYRYSPETAPISLGTTVGFLDTAGTYSRFFEMFDIKREGEPQIIDQTKVVSKLIPNSVNLISNSRENSTIFLAEKGSPDLYLYRYVVAGSERIQTAWFKWTLPFNLAYTFVLDDNLYLISSDYKLLELNLQDRNVGTSVDDFVPGVGFFGDDRSYQIHLDSAEFITAGSYSSTDNTTSISWPNRVGTGTPAVVDRDTGTVYKYKSVSGNDFVFHGNFAGQTVIMGWLFDFNASIPKFFVRKTAGEKTTSDLTASLVIQRMHLHYGDVSQVDAKVNLRDNQVVSNVLDQTPMDWYKSGKGPFVDNYSYTVPVYQRNSNFRVDITSTHPGPASLHSLTWEGDYTPMNHKRV